MATPESQHSVQEEITFPIAVILSMASPVFETMFSLPQPQIVTDVSQFEGSPSVINPAENGAVLANLLMVIYPVNPIEPRSLGDFAGTIMAAKKYEMAVPFHRLDQDFAQLVQWTPVLHSRMNWQR
ncbi:hypothetical protein BJY52DRAFT_1186990 [Lactarius psammicola]|nr:hypothetical protein BJY52DRAFT_1186990 [Lactarius psammicola]